MKLLAVVVTVGVLIAGFKTANDLNLVPTKTITVTRTVTTPVAYLAPAEAIAALTPLCAESRLPCTFSEVVAGPYESWFDGAPSKVYFVLTQHDSTSLPGTTLQWGWVMYISPDDGSYQGSE